MCHAQPVIKGGKGDVSCGGRLVGATRQFYNGVDVTALSGARGFEHERLIVPLVFSARCAHIYPTSFVVGHRGKIVW